MKRKVRVTRQAGRDLVSIARYTRTTWGAEQRDRYMFALDSRFRWLADNPGAGRDRPEIREGYRSFPEGQHVIFYLVRPESIDIIGVLHRARDMAAALRDS